MLVRRDQVVYVFSVRLKRLKIIFILFLGGTSAVALQYIQSELASVSVLKSQYPVLQYRGPNELPEVKLTQRRPVSWVVLPDVSLVAVGAVVVSEDWAFYQHEGFDWNQITEALKKDLKQGRFARGASTITQQVIKNVFLGPEKTLLRKIKEFILAVSLDRAVSKNRILEVYLNIAEWGEGLYGIGPASFYYFGKSPSQLTAKEGAFLAMLLPSPKRYSQSFRGRKLSEYARETIESILDKMKQARYLTEEQLQDQLSQPLSFETLAP
jgi:monofunctional biosynthetic peptidoglycan transglycosylase